MLLGGCQSTPLIRNCDCSPVVATFSIVAYDLDTQELGIAVQGNILVCEKVVKEMAKAYEETKGDLGDRLIAALAAGQAAGGDTRGQQSAALPIVREGWGYGGFNDRYRDIRVDDHEQPIEELKRVHELHRQVFGKPTEPNGEDGR